jgi:hypothetical protein
LKERIGKFYLLLFSILIFLPISHPFQGFSTRFRKKAGLAEPISFKDIPADEWQQIEHQPGQDHLYEQVLNEERKYAIEDDISDNLYSYQFVSKCSKDSDLSFISKSELEDNKPAAASRNNTTPTPKNRNIAKVDKEILSGATTT